MAAEPQVRFYLGANSPAGFYSLYDQLIDPAQAEDIYILKGGPGCGKSSLMRKVAQALEAHGMDVEYIQCSGDPDSLDAVIFPQLKSAIVDGTAPHAGATKGHFCRTSYFVIRCNCSIKNNCLQFAGSWRSCRSIAIAKT